jgi:hypothetical protein
MTSPAVWLLSPLVAFLLLQGSSCKSSTQPSASPTPTAPGASLPAPPSASSPASLRELPAGTWGGQHISMEVTDLGAVLNFDCAHGSINKRIAFDSEQKFSVKGSYVQEHGAAMRQDETAEGQTVTYEGVVDGESMTLKVILEETKEVIGTFTLTRGNVGRVKKCL